jgi:hypothetical protein
MSVSEPFFLVSVQLGAWHTPALHTSLAQSEFAAHTLPAAQRWHSVAPPQSISVSPPFFTESLQAAAWHTPAEHTPLAQSVPRPQAFPVAHFTAQLPPQSTSVSLPFATPSVHDEA